MDFPAFHIKMWKSVILLLVSFRSVKSTINNVDFTLYKNYTVPTLEDACLSYNSSDGVSEKCIEQLNIVCEEPTRQLLLTMLDATSKFPYTGLGYASRMDYGNYDQCLTINHEYDGGKILGKHCTFGLLIPDISNITDLNLFFKLSICKPDACSAQDFIGLLKRYIADFPPIFQDLMCATVETGKDLTATDIVTIIIFSICTLSMVLSTIYDYYLIKSQRKSHHPLLLSFSVISNGKKIFQISRESKNQIQVFHGLKVISMMWIVSGHGMAAWPNIALSNAEDIATWQSKRYAGYIATAPLAVDTFFFISGFLQAYQHLRHKAKPLMVQVSSVPGMYLHRYLRLTPALLMVFLVSISVMTHIGSGPLWAYSVEVVKDVCVKRWWEVFLYVQNYVNYDDLCLTPTWYLSADMQMFLLSPLIFIPITLQLRHYSGYKNAMIELTCLCLVFIALPMTIKLVFQDYKNPYDTHSRIINYLMGIMLAIFMKTKQDKPFMYMVRKKNVPVINFVLWVVMLLGMLSTVICYQDVEMKNVYVNMSIFYSLMRPAWCIGLSWIVYSCYHGYGGIINWILCRPIMQVLSRLTYCIYLIHGVVIAYYTLILRTQLYFSDYNAFYLWWPHYIVSILISIYWTLAFESPLIIIEKFIFGAGRKPHPRKQNGNIEEGTKTEGTKTEGTKTEGTTDNGK